MARKRMFDSEIINQDKFMDLSIGAKCIYFLLGIFADDDGFVSPKRIVKATDGTMDMLDELIDKDFLIRFETGIVAIVDWHRNNYLDKSRVKETIYTDERKELILNKDTMKYQRLTDVEQMLQENRIDQNSIDKYSIDKYSIEENRPEELSIEKKREEEISKEENKVVILSPNDCIIKDTIDYLNKKLNANYNWEDKKIKDLLNDLINKNYKKLDFTIVIDKKYDEWIKTDLAVHLTPYILFGDKFDIYLNQPGKKKTLADISFEDIDRMIANENNGETNDPFAVF